MAKTLAQLRHPVTVQNPDGPPTPDGNGGYTQAYDDATPAMAWASVEALRGLQEGPVTNAERTAVSHTVEMHYHGELTHQSRLVFKGRFLYVRGIVNVDEANDRLVVQCEERNG